MKWKWICWIGPPTGRLGSSKEIQEWNSWMNWAVKSGIWRNALISSVVYERSSVAGLNLNANRGYSVEAQTLRHAPMYDGPEINVNGLYVGPSSRRNLNYELEKHYNIRGERQLNLSPIMHWKKLHSWTRRGEPIICNTSVLKPAGLKQVISTLLIDKKAMMIVSAVPRHGILHGKWTQIVMITKQLVTAGCDVVQYEKVESLLLAKVF